MKDKIINVVKNYRPPKFVIYLLMLIPILFCFIESANLDNDTWFLLNHGRYVFEHGIPNIEPFTIHQNFSFVMQQWLSASIFWIIYRYFGALGIRLLIIFVFSIIIYIIYKLCMLVSENKYYLSSSITIIFSVFMVNFMVSRPQIFTYLVLILELYLLELYIYKQDSKYLYGLPLLSLVLINLHASMWFMLFLFMLPYLIDSFKINLGFIKGEGYNKKTLFLVLIVMLMLGLINPYGIKAITYVFNSYGIPEINSAVDEMKNLSISFSGCFYYFIIFGILFIYVFYKNGSLKLRYFLLYCGTLYLALSHYRNLSLFMIASFFPLANYLKEKYALYKNKFAGFPNKILYFYKSVVLICIGCVCLFIYNNFSYEGERIEIDKSVDYILNNYDKEKIIVYTGYGDGAYSQFMGLKTYIDPRAEVFLKANNKKEDIFIEYYNLQFENADVESFLKKYKFDILLLDKNDVIIDSVNGYELVYEDNYRKVYEKIEEID